MRRLLYVPIIHTESDMGSLGPALAQRSASLWGEGRWDRHKEVAAQFWENLARYLAKVEASNLKIYQDGLPAGGEVGRGIVEAAAKRGSYNYQIILDLMKGGAVIRQTEAPDLLRREYEYVVRLVRSKSVAGRVMAVIKYKFLKDRLTRKRDRFVAQTIAETLKEGEAGLLFMGSYHNIFPYLPRDILVHQIKERGKVNAYLKALASGRDEERLEQLAEYLISPPEPEVVNP